MIKKKIFAEKALRKGEVVIHVLYFMCTEISVQLLITVKYFNVETKNYK